jgi:hypothetical protein
MYPKNEILLFVDNSIAGLIMLCQANNLRETHNFTLVINPKRSKFIDLLVSIFKNSFNANFVVLPKEPRNWNRNTLLGTPISLKMIKEERTRRKMDLLEFHQFVSERICERFSEIWISNHPWQHYFNNFGTWNFQIVEFAHGMSDLILEKRRFSYLLPMPRLIRNYAEKILLSAHRENNIINTNSRFALHPGNFPVPNTITLAPNFVYSLVEFKPFFDTYLGDEVTHFNIISSEYREKVLILVPDFFYDQAQNVLFILKFINDYYDDLISKGYIFLKLHPSSKISGSRVYEKLCKMNEFEYFAKNIPNIKFMDIDAPVELLCNYMNIDYLFSTMSTSQLNIQTLYPHIKQIFVPSVFSKFYVDSQNIKFSSDYFKFEYFFLENFHD